MTPPAGSIALRTARRADRTRSGRHVSMRAACNSLLLLLCCVPGAATADAMTLHEVLARLAAAGEAVIYSTDVIDPNTPIDIDPVDLPTLRGWLGERNLRLEPLDDAWVIGRVAPRTAAAPADAAPEPARLVEKVIVTGTRHRLDGRNVTGSLTTLTADDLFSVPTLGSDAMRAAAQLPGMAGVGVSAKPYIRGGVQDELLVRFDGIELLDAYHLVDFQNIFSAVDDRSVGAVDVYTGGFPARYGNRMSGVMDIASAPADEAPHTELGVSLFSLLANTQGSLNGGDTGYLASVRRGNLDQILREVDPELGRPHYYDAFARLDQQLPGDYRASVSGFVSRDDISLTEDATEAASNVDSRYLWVRLEREHGRLHARHTLAYTWSERRKRQQDLDDTALTGGSLDHRVDLWKLRAASDFALHGKALQMEFGWHLEYGEARYDSRALVNRGLLGALLTGAAIDGHDIHVSPESWSGGLYWAGEFAVGPRIALLPGLRWDVQHFSEAAGATSERISPRFGLRLEPYDSLTVHLDIGRFHQSDELQELQAADGVATFFPPQRSDHFIAGADWHPGDAWNLRAEFYEKRYDGTKPRFDNLYNPFVLVPELEPDRFQLRPSRARARGSDLSLRRRLFEDAALSLHYSYMDAEDRIDGDWVPRRWSQRHTVSALAQWRGPRTTAAIALTWHSGWRGSAVPEDLEPGATLEIADVLNATELKDYLSLDVSVRRTWTWRRAEVTAFASVSNLTNRDNVAGIEYDPQLDDGEIVFERSRELLLPLVPSVGVLLRF